jgi:hypothetical protein
VLNAKVSLFYMCARSRLGSAQMNNRVFRPQQHLWLCGESVYDYITIHTHYKAVSTELPISEIKRRDASARTQGLFLGKIWTRSRSLQVVSLNCLYKHGPAKTSVSVQIYHSHNKISVVRLQKYQRLCFSVPSVSLKLLLLSVLRSFKSPISKLNVKSKQWKSATNILVA